MAFHFVGIKGTGMAALAEILHDEGFEVNGSDIEKYIFTQDGLEQRGIEIQKFDPANIKDGDTVIVGLSFDETHPEVAAAMANPNVQVFYYNDYLGELLKRYTSVCIAGTHGKSTSTGLLAKVLNEDHPSGFLIGDGHGHMPEKAEDFVLESCEFQRHFLAYRPDYAIITNIELDHVDYYRDMDDYVSAFQEFGDQVKKAVVVCGDDEHLNKMTFKAEKITYGVNDGNDYQAVNIHDDDQGIRYDVKYDGQIICHLELTESGYPFMIDSLGVFAMAHVLGVKPDIIAKGLADYTGINRRFVIEEVGDSVLIDDYAHHPTAIKYMIEAARSRYPGKKVIALYKPDRYSRLQYFLDRFAESLNLADQSAVLDFPKNAVREDETVTVTIDDLLERLDNGKLLDINDESAQWLKDQGDAVYVFMSSKDIYLLRDKLRELLENR